MEKDNRKARDDGRREYNDTVRVRGMPTPSTFFPLTFFQSLAKFLRKRDPRYKAFQQAQATANTTANPPKPASQTLAPPPKPLLPHTSSKSGRRRATTTRTPTLSGPSRRAKTRRQERGGVG